MVKKLINNTFETNLLENFVLNNKTSNEILETDSFMSSIKNLTPLKSIDDALLALLSENNTLLFTDFELTKHKDNLIKLSDINKNNNFLYNFSLIKKYDYLYGFKLKNYDEVLSLEKRIKHFNIVGNNAILSILTSIEETIK